MTWFGILPLAAIITTVLFVGWSPSPGWAKATAIAVCVASFLVPRVFPGIGYVSMAIQALLAVALLIALRFQRVIR